MRDGIAEAVLEMDWGDREGGMLPQCIPVHFSDRVYSGLKGLCSTLRPLRLVPMLGPLVRAGEGGG